MAGPIGTGCRKIENRFKAFAHFRLSGALRAEKNTSAVVGEADCRESDCRQRGSNGDINVETARGIPKRLMKLFPADRG